MKHTTLNCYSNVFSHFKSHPLTACSMLVTYTTQPTHFNNICTYEMQTCYSGPTTCTNPSHFNLIHTTCTTCHMRALSSHNPQPLHTDNVPYKTPQGTPIGLVHTHHIMSSMVQLVLVHSKLHHGSISSRSCPMGHCPSVIIRTVEQ